MLRFNKGLISIKQIKNYDFHYIDEEGFVYSKYKGTIKRLKTFYDSNNRYECIVISENGKRNHHLIHRLVAETYLDNPNNCSEVNHIDNNPHNNHLSNLEWCDRKYNVEQSYKTMSSNRNYIVCELYVGDNLIGKFDGIRRAAKYAAEHFNVSASSLEKYLHSKNISILIK